MSRGVVLAICITMALLTILTMVALVVESKKSKELRERTRLIQTEVAVVPDMKSVDYSSFETIVGGDGREMVLIPGGSFTMGGGPEGDFDEQPQRVIYLDGYYMDKHEVTNADYARFAKMLKRPLPTIPVFEDDVNLLKGETQPVVGVTWIDAFAYCKWAGKRLPTEAEWEKAARGENGQTFPWGDSFNVKLANGRGDEDGFKYSAPIGSFEQGRSPYGLYDMAGNVSEWVSDWYDQFYYKTSPFKNPQGPAEPDINKVLVYRGGSFNNSPHDLRASKRFGGAHADRGESSVGVRCARDLNVQ
ncbi:MAG: formylglycine-generating enzyme family protein [Candidatus Manganitrophus sp. SB1]|nr:formylglycine-generating enzyme family protein [Candidatus Manganitrophus morganii]